ncbi:Protein CREG2 [Exaiptasia diaphana]|nr:Protein CREG2 [Exaiptasia diaphana]
MLEISGIKSAEHISSWPSPPPYQNKAAMARYLVHYSDWTIVSAFSPEYLQPFGTLQSYADGVIGNSTGIPYFYISKFSDTYKNIEYNNTVAVTVTENESELCKQQGYDPEEPVCSRVTITGEVVAVTDSKELAFAKVALFTRHPAMKGWPSSHDWTFYKLVPTHVHLLDFYGGASHVPLNEYFQAKP